MKIRQGFVSNSSSSSFYCAICDDTIAGWDSDLDSKSCSGCGNEFCSDHFSAGSFECPICSLETIPEHIKYAYALRRLGMDNKRLEHDLRAEFGTFKQLRKELFGYVGDDDEN